VPVFAHSAGPFGKLRAGPPAQLFLSLSWLWVKLI
jgi:hypothetical protein